MTAYRARKAREGFVRVEVNVHKQDAGLLRRVVSALADPSRQVEARDLLQRGFADRPRVSLKALLAAAPLEGVGLDRTRDLGRDVDL